MGTETDNPFVGKPLPQENPFQGHTNVEGTGFVDESLPVNKPGERPYRPEIPLSEVPAEIGKTVYNTFTKDIPDAVKRAADDPLGYAKGVGMMPIHMIKSTLDLFGLPFTGAAYGTALAGESLGITPKWLTEDAYAKVKPGVEILDEFQRKYGSWLGGPGNWGWTPEKGWENLKRTVSEQPFETTADVVSAAGPQVGRIVGKRTPGGTVPNILMAAKKLEDAGIDTTMFNQAQIERLRARGNEIGWSKEQMNREAKQLLFGEFGITPTESMLTGSESLRKWMDDAREGVYGEAAAIKANEIFAKQRVEIEKSSDRLRRFLTGSQDRIDPATAGNTVTTRYNLADDAAKENVGRAYDKAFDPNALNAAGVPAYIPEASVQGLPAALDARLTGAQQPFVATGATAPNTLEAVTALKEYAKTGRLPNVISGEAMPPGGNAGISWQSADQMRKWLVGMRETARANPTDFHGLTRVLDAFDSQFGKANSLLNDARRLHGERMKTFHPDEWSAGDDVVKATEVLSNRQNNGLKQFNKLFGTEFNSGEAIGAINHLKEIFKGDPAAMQALKEGALEKLFIDQKDYFHLTPQQKATAVERALHGPKAEIYKALFTPDELAMLKRHQSVIETVAEHTSPTNPPKSGQTKERLERSRQSAESVNNYIRSLMTLGGTYLAPKYGFTPIEGSGAGLGAGYGAGQVLSGPLGRVYQSTILDPKERMRAESMINPAPQTKPGMSQREAIGATVGGMSTMGSEEPPQSQPRARGGILRRLERH